MDCCQQALYHYNDVIMDAIASQITSLTIVFSTVYSDANQRKHEISVSKAFVHGIHQGPVNSLHKWPVMRKIFPFDDVIMLYLVSNSCGPHHFRICVCIKSLEGANEMSNCCQRLLMILNCNYLRGWLVVDHPEVGFWPIAWQFYCLFWSWPEAAKLISIYGWMQLGGSLPCTSIRFAAGGNWICVGINLTEDW